MSELTTHQYNHNPNFVSWCPTAWFASCHPHFIHSRQKFRAQNNAPRCPPTSSWLPNTISPYTKGPQPCFQHPYRNTILMIYTDTAAKADSLSSLAVDFQCLDWTPMKKRKEPAVYPPPVTGMQCSYTSGDTGAAGARVAVPSICQVHHLPSFLLLAGSLWSLSTHLGNWAGISKKHRPNHAHGRTNARHSLDS